MQPHNTLDSEGCAPDLLELMCCEAPELQGGWGGTCTSSWVQVPKEVKETILQRSGTLGYMPRRNQAGYVRGNHTTPDRAYQEAFV